MSKKHYGRELPGQNLQRNKSLVNKQSKKLAAYGYGLVIHKTSRQRDIAGLTAICLFILLCVSLYFNALYWWPKL